MARSLTQCTALRVAFATLGAYSAAAWAIVTLASFVIAAPAARAATPCSDWHAELTTVEGAVDVKRSGESIWRSALSGTSLCYGDAISVKGSSRATFTLPDHSTLRLDENTTITLVEPEQSGGSLIDLLRGVIHVISRDPRSLKFTTPYANAGLEGTEFDIRVSEREQQTEVVVLEGKVAMSTPGGDLGVPSGQIAVAHAGQPPTAEPVREPIELMRWTGHYPRIVDRPLPAADEPTPASADAEFFARRAAARLETARVDAASADLETALRLVPAQPMALALQAMMASARAYHDAAIRLATAATTAPKASAETWLALSYAQESVGDLDGSSASAIRAAALEPDNALALSRMATLALAHGDVGASIEHATRAARLAPRRAEPVTVLGFAYLSQLDSAAARNAFERAVELEPAAPLPRRCRGLALIQGGDMIGGRQQIELAVALDPTNALARSYMAKVYEAENRAKLTGSQLDLAKRFDPLDPTPWLYAALQKLRANRPVEAFHDLQTANSKNGDRVTLRSWLPVDSDLATRSSSIARVDAELGFDRLVLADAWQAVGDRPSDYAGHRLLADAYAREPREELARVSENFVAQLLQPANLTPIPAQLGQPSTFLAAHLGPGLAPLNELGSPVTQNGLRLQASGAAGGNGTSGTEAAVAGLRDQLSYGFGQYRFESDGFRINNDRDLRIANAFVQFRPALDTNLQIELRSTRNSQGDLAMSFDPNAYDPVGRFDDASDSLRFGARHNLTAHDTLLASASHERGSADITGGDAFEFLEQVSTSSIDLQLIHEAGALRLQAGLAHASRKASGETHFAFPGDPPTVSKSTDNFRQTDLYGYVLIDPVPSVTITAGAAWDRVGEEILTKHEANPKIGVTWRPTSHTTVRATTFRSLSGSLTTSRSNPQPRLEPVQVAGFSQLLFGGAADHSTVRGLAIDHTLSERLFAGWEASHRDTDTSILYPTEPPELQVQDVTLRQRTQRAYVYWTPHDRLGFSAKLEHGRYTGTLPLNGIPLFNSSDMTIERLPIELRYFSPTGLMLGFRTSHIKEHGTFVMTTPIPGTLAPGEDRFWLLDAFVGYRLPNRRGLLSLNADNLLDRRFRFQDVDPEDTSLIPERLISFRFTLSFD
jgi:tetratricopeptide (TPR) repeat protein